MIITKEFVQEVYKNAVEHGFYDDKPTFAKIIGGIHTELSEAFTEYDNGNPMIYYRMIGDNKPEGPEGVAVELADCVLRILSYCGGENLETDICDEISYEKLCDDFDIYELIDRCHYELSMLYGNRNALPYLLCHFATCIHSINTYLFDNNLDLNEIMHIKHEFNKTQPWKHNGKKI